MNSLISKPQSAQSNTFSYRPCKALPYSLPFPRQILQLYVHIYILIVVSAQLVSKVSQQIQKHVAVCVSLILSLPFSFHLPKAGLDYFEMLFI